MPRWLLLAVVLSLLPRPALAAGEADVPLAGGHFYSQANGQGGGPGQPGFDLTDDDGIPFWSSFAQQGGVAALGYPISSRFSANGLTDQALQKGLFQWDGNRLTLVNVLDVLHDKGFDPRLQADFFVPPPADSQPDTGLTWSQVEARHQRFLDANPAIRGAYFAVPDPLAQFGLPVSLPTVEAGGALIVVRLQRAVLQQWLTAQPWAAAGTVTSANAGDIAKALGLIPAAALAPQSPPGAAPDAVSALLSDSWAGYEVALDRQGVIPGSVTVVDGSWNVPAVDCSSTPDAAVGIWIGIDGVDSNTVEQTGTAASCSHGAARYYAWLQVYPAAAGAAALPIAPGDTVVAEVRVLDRTRVRLSLRDVTTGQGFSVERAAPGHPASAEWVVEAPLVDGQVAPLANFGRVTIGGATATIAGQTGGFNAPAQAATSIGMLDMTGRVRAIPSLLDRSGQLFSVSWLRS